MKHCRKILFVIGILLFLQVDTVAGNISFNYKSKDSQIRPNDTLFYGILECDYENGFLTIGFTENVGTASLYIYKVSDSGADFDELFLPPIVFSTDTPYSIYLGELNDSLKIIIETNNAIYEAIIP